MESHLDRERHQLPLGIPMALAAGMAAYLWLGNALQWTSAIALGLGLALLMWRKASVSLLRRCLIWAGLLFAIGLAWVWVFSLLCAQPRLSAPVPVASFEAELLRTDHLAARDQWHLLVRPRGATDLPPLIRLSLRDEGAPALQRGMILQLRARLMPPAAPLYPGGYDFSRTAWFDELGATGQLLDSPKIIGRTTGKDWGAGFHDVRHRLTQRLQQALPPDQGGLAAALVTGDRGGISDAINQDMRDSGLAHLLSISGLHIAALCALSFLIVRKSLTASLWIGLHWPTFEIAALGAAVAAVAYTVLAGMSVPTVRACLAAVIALLAVVMGRSAISLRMVAGAAVIIMAFAPDALWGPSFQMSFLSISGIIALYQEDKLRLLTKGEKYDHPLYSLMRHVAMLALAGLVAEALLAPVALYHFGRASFYGIFSNIIAIPLTSFVILPLLGLFVLLDFVGGAWLVTPLLGASIQLWIDIAHVTAHLPGAVLHSARMSDAAFGLWLIGILWLLMWRTHVRFWGGAPILLGFAVAYMTPVPDLLVREDGRHVIVYEDAIGWTLRTPLSDYHRQNYMEAGAVDDIRPMDAVAGRCTADSCWWPLGTGPKTKWLLALRSDVYIRREVFEFYCQKADIIVSPRRLPHWCQPRWLRLDKPLLARTGGMLIDLKSGRWVTVAQRRGDHPWARLNSDAAGLPAFPVPAPDAKDSAAGHKRDWLGRAGSSPLRGADI